MKFKFMNFSFFFLLISNILIFFSNSWFFMWMIMEMNLICFIKILTSYKNFKVSIIMNYFLIQSLNSYLFIISSMILQNNFMLNIFKLIIIMSLICKMGLPPFLMWYFKMMMKINCWMMFFINSCLQKFIPMFIISNIMMNNSSIMSIMIFYSLMSIISIPFMGINSLNMWLIMSVSSLIQTIWILMYMIISELWILYFLIYSLISLSTMLMFKLFNINHLIDMYNMKINKKMMFFSINMNMMAFGGLPPFLGFLNKLIFTWSMLKMNFYMNFTFMIMSLINLYFYIRVIFSSLMNSFNSKNLIFKFMNFNDNKIKMMINLLYISILGMLIMELF